MSLHPDPFSDRMIDAEFPWPACDAQPVRGLPTDDSYWREMMLAEVEEEMRQLWGEGPAGRMLCGGELRRWEQLERVLSELREVRA